MDEKQFYLPDTENHFISGHALGKLLRRADGNAALLYLYILQNQGRLRVAEAMETLHLTEREVYDSAGVLATLGLISGTGAKVSEKKSPEPADQLPQYTADELEREITTNSSFAALTKEVERKLGKILSTDELVRLMGIHRDLGLATDVIYQLVDYMVREHQEKYGRDKYPTVRGIEKMAHIWHRENVNTLDAAVEYIGRRESYKTQIGQIKKVLDIKSDQLTPTQEKYIQAWLDMGFDPEVISAAYDITVVNTGSLKWQYMNKVLSNWHQKDLLTVEAVRASGGVQTVQVMAGQKAPAPVPDRREIERKRQLLEKLKQSR